MSNRTYKIVGKKLSKFKKPVLALGSHIKSSICLLGGGKMQVVEFTKGLDDANTALLYEKKLRLIAKKFRAEVAACDMHPDYFSTRCAQRLGLPLKMVQHHHAHIASCMADNGLAGKVIGVALDGTGYGADSNIWGGEFLIADYKGFERFAHFDYVPMPGGDMAIRQPWRMACAYLDKYCGKDFLKVKNAFTQAVDKRKWAVLKGMIKSNVNSPLTSSAGRLFDAVASLCRIKDEVDFEAQAAIGLEKIIEATDKRYGFKIERKGKRYIVNFGKMFKDIVKDLENKQGAGIISCKFHNTVAWAVAEACKKARRLRKLDRVALSGGVFQNRYLLDRTVELLEKNKFKVYTHNMVPVNDLGISVGQAVIACV